MAELAVADPQNLPVGPIGRRGMGWWGVGTLIASEAALFSYLLFGYYYTGASAHVGWLLENAPDLKRALPNTLLLLASSGVAWCAEWGISTGRRPLALVGFGLTALMGTAFVAVQWLDWQAKPFSLGTSSYASLYFMTTGFHVAHVLAGIAVFAALFVWTALDYFSPRRSLVVSAGVVYWHFVNVVSLLVFGTFYLSPYLGFGR